MGAVEILKVLSKGECLTSVEIAERSHCGLPAVMQTLKRLLKDSSENVCFRVLTSEEKKERYGRGLGVKMHIYWIED